MSTHTATQTTNRSIPFQPYRSSHQLKMMGIEGIVMIPLFVLWGAIVLLQAYARVGQEKRCFLTVAPHRALLFTTSASGHSSNYRYQGTYLPW